MIAHIAIFKWKQNISESEIEQVFMGLRKLKSKVNGLIDIFCGENFSKWNEGYTHAVVVLAKNRKALEAYRKHSDHEDIAARIENMEV